MSARTLTAAQLSENAAFLAELRRTGNTREAARRLGAHRAKFTRRRAKHPGFAIQWEAALTFAQERLARPPRGKSGDPPGPKLLRRADGTLQLRRLRAGALDQAALTRFLAALAACANVRLAARAAGFSHAAFYHHKRRDPAFAREWRLALQTGYERLEAALLAGWSHEEGSPDDWSHNEPPAIPPMSAGEALQLLYLHQKEARLWATPTPLRRRPGESRAARDLRLTLTYQACEARWHELEDRSPPDPRDTRPSPHDPAPPALPDLAQVTGWSKASGKPAHDETRALFGGWRLGLEAAVKQERGSRRG